MHSSGRSKTFSLSWQIFLCACLMTPAMLQAASSVSTAPVERLRTIPEDAKKGVMWPPQGRRVRINDSILVLAPGVTIRDMSNRMVLPNTVRRPKKIRYTLDLYGQVRRIWISPSGEYLGRHQPTLPPKPHD
jgi:hypothetical protein